MPDFEHDRFALLDRQFSQTAHRSALGWTFRSRLLEPALRFQLARQSTPERTPIIQRAISETPHAVMFGPERRVRPVQQRHECLLQNVLGFAVTQAQRASIEDQLRRFCVVKLFLPEQ